MWTPVQRAYSLLEIKSVDRAQRVITGIASTPEVDRGGDSMDPAGAKFTLPMPFLWAHNDQEPIGEVFAADVKADGIHIKARISSVAPNAPASLRERLETAWYSISANPPLVRGLSIGWSPIKSSMSGKVRRVSEWIWGETSAVTIPMNANALITSVKSLAQFDRAQAASGVSAVSSSPGVSGSSRNTHMTISEQLTAERNNLQVKRTRLEELMNDESTNGGLDEAETSEKQTLLTDVKGLTQKVSELQTLEDAMMAGAASLTPVQQAAPVARQKQAPAHDVKLVELPKGTIFTRYAMAVAAGKGSYSDTLAYAKRWTNTPQVMEYVKAVEGTSVVQSPGWGGELVNPDTAQTEFVELIRAQTIVGRVQGFRRVPFNVPIITQTGGSTFEWVGEGGVKPVGELAFERRTMDKAKVAGIIVLSEELIRLSRPDAEATVRQDLTEQGARFIDEQFIRIAVTAGANNPASITNGVNSPSASGTTLAALMADLNTAISTIAGAGLSIEDLVIVTTPAVALRLSLMVTTLGQAPNGFNVTPTGGTLLGYQVIVSNSVDAGTMVIFKPSEILLADDGRITLDASNQATLDMSGGSSPNFNLWQRNCVGIRAEQWIRWEKRRTNVEPVAIIDTIAYVPGT